VEPLDNLALDVEEVMRLVIKHGSDNAIIAPTRNDRDCTCLDLIGWIIHRLFDRGGVPVVPEFVALGRFISVRVRFR